MEGLPAGNFGQAVVPTWLLGQASPIDLAVMLAIHQAPDHCISVADIGTQAGVSRRTVSRTLRRLEDRGWLAWEATVESDGAIGPNLYSLKDWAPPAPAQAPRPLPEILERSGKVPVDLLTSCVSRKGALFVYVVLQAFEAPSISMLAVICGMSPEDVRRSLRFLEDEGWIQQITRPGATSLFRVFFERIGAFHG